MSIETIGEMEWTGIIEVLGRLTERHIISWRPALSTKEDSESNTKTDHL